jgi:mycoredoxin
MTTTAVRARHGRDGRMTRPEDLTMLTMYSTPWCGYCHRLKSQLDREGIAYQVIDIEQDPASAEFVMSVNGGNQTVPTIRFADGTTMTNPSITQVKQHLATLAGS